MPFRCVALLFASLLLFPVSWLSADENRPADPPNILVLIGDDIGLDYGCYGNKGIRTPNVDRLAKEGLLFRNAFLTTSSCSPSRISILTGLYPHQTGAEDLHMPLPADKVFVSSRLREKGYFTGHMQKTHYGPEGIRQFDWYSQKLRDFPAFLDARGDRPFFMWVGFSDAHRPYQGNAVEPPHNPADVTVPPYLADTPKTRADLVQYYDEVSRMDESIGRMVAALKERKLYENTLIVVLADNGMPFPRAKGTAYDSGIATPFVVCWPKVIAAGGEARGLTSVIDLAPTILDAAGLAPSRDLEGKSLLPVFRNPALPGRDYIFAERNWHNADEHIRCVRTLRYKLIENAYLDLPYGHPSDCSSSPSWEDLLELKKAGKLTPAQAQTFQVPRPRFELYDVEQDPHELKNLADSPEHAAVFKELQTALAKWREETQDFPASTRRRADNVDRVTGEKFTNEIGPQVESGDPPPLPRRQK